MKALVEPDTPSTFRIRQIENEFVLKTVAQSSQELVEFQRASLCAQVGVAQELGNIGSLISLFGREAIEGLHSISSQLGRMNEQIDGIIDLQFCQLDALEDIRHFLEEGFSKTAELLLENQRLLRKISNQLGAPYEMKALELKREAKRWISHGMNSSQRRSNECYHDAIILLEQASTNPIGNQDYEVWFNLGWLNWKHRKDIPQALSAFHRASHLAELSQDAYFTMALRHEAYMQYLTGDLISAVETAQEAVAKDRSGQNLFDLARYLSRAGDDDEAVKALEEAIVKHPPLIITMYGEADFAN